MNYTVGVGADDDRNSRTFAVDDDGWMRGGAWRGWLGVGLPHDGFNLPELSTLDGSRPLLPRAAVSAFNLDQIGVGGNFAVDVSAGLDLVAGRVKALVALHVVEE